MPEERFNDLIYDLEESFKKLAGSRQYALTFTENHRWLMSDVSKALYKLRGELERDPATSQLVVDIHVSGLFSKHMNLNVKKRKNVF